MKTIDDALRWADTFDSPHSKHMGLVMLAAEVRRLRGELDGLTVQRDAMLEQLKMSREVIAQQAAALKEAQEQEPVAFVCDYNGYAIDGKHTEIDTALPVGTDLYVRPVPAVTAVAVVQFSDNELDEIHQLAYELGGTENGEYILDGEQLDQVIVKAASLFYKPAVAVPVVPTDEQIHAAYRKALGQSIRERDMPEIRKFARALLQSADHSELAIEKVAPDCRACVNRGRINGLSQESYCDSCIYQGRDWRKNHFVDASKMADAVKRRCDACAILPCSCK